LIEIAEQFGFVAVRLQELSLAQSIEVVLGAEFIVGPHGAGWANALFARAGTKGLLWTWRAASEYNWFKNLAQVAGMNLRVTFTDESGLLGPHDVDPKVFRGWISDLIAGP
jgi:capsular polysaccharide biosynthesis protein